jgi:hypothetical protein
MYWVGPVSWWTFNRAFALTFDQRGRETYVLPKDGCWVLTALQPTLSTPALMAHLRQFLRDHDVELVWSLGKVVENPEAAMAELMKELERLSGGV